MIKSLCTAAALLVVASAAYGQAKTTKPTPQEMFQQRVASSPKDSSVVLQGALTNCTQDPIPSVLVLLHDSSGKVLTLTLTDMMGRYSFTASKASVFGLQIVFNKDSSQIVTGLVASKDNGIMVDFTARNLPIENLFPAMPSPSDMMMPEAAKKQRNEMKRMLNGDASLIAATQRGRFIPTAQGLLLGSVSLGAQGIYYGVQDKSTVFADLEGNIPPTKVPQSPIHTGDPMMPMGR